MMGKDEGPCSRECWKEKIKDLITHTQTRHFVLHVSKKILFTKMMVISISQEKGRKEWGLQKNHCHVQ